MKIGLRKIQRESFIKVETFIPFSDTHSDSEKNHEKCPWVASFLLQKKQEKLALFMVD